MSNWETSWDFRSPEPKAELSFSDHNMSVVCRRRCRHGHRTEHPSVKGIQVYTKEGQRPFRRGDNKERVKIY